MKKIIFVFWFLVVFLGLYSEIRMVAEWEPMIGTLIRWPLGIPQDLVVELASDDSLFVLVQNSTQESHAIGLFSNAGVNLSNVRFIYATTNTHWTRDWGPHSAFINGEYTIINPIFDGYPWVPGRSRLYDDDNMVNITLADELNANLVNFPAYLTGGNFMSDGYTTAFSTQQMLDENLPLHSYQEFIDLSAEFLGIENYQFTINPEFHGIQHIDCWAKLLNEETVLVKKLEISHPEYHRAETLATFFANQTNVYGENYLVKRIECPDYAYNQAAAYTNSLILNKKVLVPLFGIPADSLALQTYREAMPGYMVKGFYFNAWYYYDALHCRTMGIADRDMLRIEHIPQSLIESSDDTITLSAKIIAYSAYDLNNSNLKLHYSKLNEGFWQEITLSSTGDGFYSAEISDILNDELIEYYFEAEDDFGKHAFLPVNAPNTFFSTSVLTNVSNHDVVQPQKRVFLYPNPVKDMLNLSILSSKANNNNISIYNIKGQKIYSSDINIDKFSLKISQLKLNSGIYYLKIQNTELNEIKRFLYIK